MPDKVVVQTPAECARRMVERFQRDSGMPWERVAEMLAVGFAGVAAQAKPPLVNVEETQRIVDEVTTAGGFVHPSSMHLPDGGYYESGGITLRNYAAIQIAAGMAAAIAPGHSTLTSQRGPGLGELEHAARWAYSFADALLHARAQEGKGGP